MHLLAHKLVSICFIMSMFMLREKNLGINKVYEVRRALDGFSKCKWEIMCIIKSAILFKCWKALQWSRKKAQRQP